MKRKADPTDLFRKCLKQRLPAKEGLSTTSEKCAWHHYPAPGLPSPWSPPSPSLPMPCWVNDGVPALLTWVFLHPGYVSLCVCGRERSACVCTRVYVHTVSANRALQEAGCQARSTSEAGEGRSGLSLTARSWAAGVGRVGVLGGGHSQAPTRASPAPLRTSQESPLPLPVTVLRRGVGGWTELLELGLF